MKAYVQLMGGKHKVVVLMPSGLHKVSLQPAYSSKASAEQACKTWGLTLVEASDDPPKQADIDRRVRRG